MGAIQSTVSGGGSVASGVSPAGYGLGLLTMQPYEPGTSLTLTDTSIFLTLVTAAVSKSITKMGVYLTRAGVTPGVNANGLALYSEAGVLLGQTADMTTAFESTLWAEGTLTAAVPVVAGTNYFWGISGSFTGTTAQVAAIFTNVLDSGLNGHFPAEQLTGTAFPASFTPGAGLSTSLVTLGYGR